MASTQSVKREEARLKVLRYISEFPEASTRQIAEQIGISNGQSFYVLKSFVDKGLVKVVNFANSKNKSQYLYLLTAKGVVEKLRLTEKFLELKREEYRLLRKEIDALASDIEGGSLTRDLIE